MKVLVQWEGKSVQEATHDNIIGRGQHFDNQEKRRFNPSRGRGRGRFRQERKDVSHDDYDKSGRYPRNQSKFVVDISKVRCFNCNDIGHYALNCPKPNKKEETTNLIQEDEEPTLLMVQIEDGVTQKEYEDMEERFLVRYRLSMRASGAERKKT
ncbi:hypothetical protein E3N88_44287 [Mikania micrantha]|uniref:CCHC-type domain-containing protein n=1 Tax=Mikania micrantha TaxID=192012 RepID=A0A5N6LCG1_9ASTR|nr:hypothetical protein E3N88_44287 [Mikania micrantha]